MYLINLFNVIPLIDFNPNNLYYLVEIIITIIQFRMFFMRTVKIPVVLIFSAIFMISGIHAQQNKKTIAVLNLVNSGGVDKDEISILTDRFNNYLVNTNVYKVLEREKMDAILKEQDFTMTDNCNSAECAVQIGQLLGMELMITGKIGKFGTMYTLDLRIIDVTTGEILRTKSENYKGEKEGLLDMVEALAYTIAGLTVSEKKTKTTTGKSNTDDAGDDISIGTVTEKHGSLEIKCEMDGVLFIGDKQIGDVSAGTKIPIEKLKTGRHIIRITGSGGEVIENVNIEYNQKSTLTVKAKKKNEIILSGHSNELVFIKGGTFQMGDTWGDGEYYEKPAHTVTVGDFYMSKFEVTQKLWYQVMGNNSSNFSCYECPVENVSWNDVLEFLRILNAKTGKNYRLPYEAEWEYAAREGGKSNTKYSGSDNADEVAWYYYNSDKMTHPVGQKKPNALGLYDMSGNIDEWCEDWYDNAYYANSPADNPKGPASGSKKVLRGGAAWINLMKNLSYRYGFSPNVRYSYIGFRLVLPAQ